MTALLARCVGALQGAVWAIDPDEYEGHEVAVALLKTRLDDAFSGEITRWLDEAESVARAGEELMHDGDVAGSPENEAAHNRSGGLDADVSRKVPDGVTVAFADPGSILGELGRFNDDVSHGFGRSLRAVLLDVAEHLQGEFDLPDEVLSQLPAGLHVQEKIQCLLELLTYYVEAAGLGDINVRQRVPGGAQVVELLGGENVGAGRSAVTPRAVGDEDGAIARRDQPAVVRDVRALLFELVKHEFELLKKVHGLRDFVPHGHVRRGWFRSSGSTRLDDGSARIRLPLGEHLNQFVRGIRHGRIVPTRNGGRA